MKSQLYFKIGSVPIWHWTASGGEAPILDIWEVWCTLSLPLLPCPLWIKVVIPVRFISINQIDLFQNDSYLIGLCEKKHKKILPKNINLNTIPLHQYNQNRKSFPCNFIGKNYDENLIYFCVDSMISVKVESVILSSKKNV